MLLSHAVCVVDEFHLSSWVLSFTAGSPSSRPRSSPSTYWVAGSASESGEEVGVWWWERFDNLTSNDEKGLLCVFALLRLAWMPQKKRSDVTSTATPRMRG